MTRTTSRNALNSLTNYARNWMTLRRSLDAAYTLLSGAISPCFPMCTAKAVSSPQWDTDVCSAMFIRPTWRHSTPQIVLRAHQRRHATSRIGHSSARMGRMLSHSLAPLVNANSATSGYARLVGPDSHSHITRMFSATRVGRKPLLRTRRTRRSISELRTEPLR